MKDSKTNKKNKVTRVSEADLAAMTPDERLDMAFYLTLMDMEREAEVKAAGGARIFDLAAYRARKGGGHV